MRQGLVPAGRRGRALALAAAAGLAAATFGAAAAAAAASPWQDHDVVRARLVAAAPAADGTLRLGLHFRLAEGWHVYWKHGGDAGLPPVVELSGDVPVADVRLQFPAPTRYRLPGDLVALGYSDEVVYPLRARAVDAAPTRLLASVDYLACEEECIPFHDDLALELAPPSAGETAGGEEEALLADWEARLPVTAASLGDVGAAATLRRLGEEGELAIALDGVTAATDLFVERIEGLELGPPRSEPRPGGLLFRLPVQPEVTGVWPERPRVAWTATGVRTAAAAAPLAVEGVDTALPAAAPGDLTTQPEPAGRFPLPLGGGILALTPAALALLVLLALGPPERPLRWTAPLAAAATFAAAIVAAGLVGRRAGVALPLAEPLALALLALPTLGLAVALWSGGGDRLRRAHPAALGAAAALLALPWAVSLLPGSWSLVSMGVTAAGFAVPVAVAALVPWRPRPRAFGLDGVLGFLAVAALLWISHRLAAGLLRHEVAVVQLAWLGAALGGRLAAVQRGAARWVWAALAAAAAAASLWVVR